MKQLLRSLRLFLLVVHDCSSKCCYNIPVALHIQKLIPFLLKKSGEYTDRFHENRYL